MLVQLVKHFRPASKICTKATPCVEVEAGDILQIILHCVIWKKAKTVFVNLAL